MKRIVGMAVAGLVWLACAGQSAAVDSRIGGGVAYWFKADDINVPDASRNGVAWLFSYKLVPEGLLRYQIDVELLPDRFAGAEKEVLAPEVALVIGYGLYAGVGAGWYYDTDSGFADHPFYTLRGGLDFALLPALRADLFMKYRLEKWDAPHGVHADEDTVEIGAALLLEL